MNRIVREHYPVSDLPEDLREGLSPDARVRVTIEPAQPKSKLAFSLDELFARARPSFNSSKEIVDHIRSIREEWD